MKSESMTPSQYLRDMTSRENYFEIWGMREKIPKEMDKLFISRKEILDMIRERCYCRNREGTFMSETNDGKQYCAFCWLKKQIE